MLLVILYFFALKGLMWLLDIPFRNKIKQSTSVEESLKARKRLKVFRRFWSVLLIIASCVLIIWIYVSNDATNETINGSNAMGRDIGMFIAFSMISGYKRIVGNVQSFSKEKYLEKHGDGFILYLRAFDTDYYTRDPRKISFEMQLAKAVKKKSGKKMCAIGMTKEVDAPYGADRVYVGDETWKEDVKELMEKASSVFILVSDRESCIWEIKQSAPILKNCCYIIKSKSEYESVKDEATSLIPFPTFEKLAEEMGSEEAKRMESGESMIGLKFDKGKYDVLSVGNLKDFVYKALYG